MAFYRASSSPSPYDLRSIIQLYPEQEPWCVGFAVTRGRRCHNQTSAVSREKACSLLDRGTRDLAQGLNINDLLDQLAPLVLCKRWHQYECHDLVGRWARKVEDFQMRQNRASSIRTTPTTTISRSSSSSPSTLGYPYTPGYSETNHYRRHGSPDEICSAQRINDLLQSMSDRLDRVVESLEDSGQPAVRPRHNAAGRPAQRQASSLAAGAATSRSASRTVEPDDSSVRNRGSTSTSTRTERIPERTRSSSETRPSSSTTTRETPSTTTVSGPQTLRTIPPTRPTRVRVSLVRVPEVNISRITSTPTTTRRIVTQKPIEGDCSICTNSLIHEEDHSTENSSGTENERESSGQLSWCRAQCGTNYHKECIDQWLSTCRDMFRNPTCPYCRAQWVE
ncbi:hypothetical protein DTO282E5_4744 [Paecilomyces variotii]|nr:hypothetical protein DTO282E5_4744 [Paecilomyces variotii]